MSSSLASRDSSAAFSSQVFHPVRKCVSYYEDRETEADLKGILLHQGKLQVTGMTGSGKTQLCRRVVHLVAEENEIDVKRQTMEINFSSMTQDSAERLKKDLLNPGNQIKIVFFDNVNVENIAYVNEISDIPGILCVTATKDSSILFPQVTRTVHGMNLGQIKRLIEKLGVNNCSREEMNELVIKFGGLPLAVVTAAKHMKSNESTLSVYFRDVAEGYEDCVFMEGEYDVAFVKAVNRDLIQVLQELTPQEKKMLLSIAYMGRPVPIDVTCMSQADRSNIVESRILKILRNRSFAKVDRIEKSRMIELHACIRDLLLKTDKECSVNIKDTLKTVNKAFCKDVRFKENFNLQQCLLPICIHMLENYGKDLKPDLVTGITKLELWDKVGHMYCQNKNADDAKKAFDSALDQFDDLFIKPEPGRNPQLPLQARIASSKDSTAVGAELFEDIMRGMAIWSDKTKVNFFNFVDDKVCHQIVSDDNLVKWRAGLTKREDGVFEDDSNNMSPAKYKCLITKGKAIKLELMRSIYPIELLVMLLYSRGRLSFYCQELMHPKLAERHFGICQTLCRQVKNTYNVTLLHGMLCQINGSLYFLIDDKEHNIRKRRKDCGEAIRAYQSFLNSTEKYFEFGLLKHQGGELGYTRYIFLRQILKAQQLIIKDNTDKLVFDSAKNDLITHEELLIKNTQDLTHRVKILNVIGKMWLQIGDGTECATDYKKAEQLFSEVCKLVSTANNELTRTLSADWQEALTALKNLKANAKLTEDVNLGTLVKEFRKKCKMANLDIEPAKVLLMEVELGHVSPCLSNVECFHSRE